ncbi:MAG: MmcQ/YjbR family DNA-binding protein [Clostridiaceae bacterium]|jgi:predicted DNA-binding protein (MmcQ/YjbR family)|nr:MmcQ/YjbR family DNA-binding protein [Clostridiaceae bacterium]
MNYPWLEEYFLSKLGAEKEFKPEWDAFRYMICGKMFGLQGTDKTGKGIITLKLEPAMGQCLRDRYPTDITSGYYMNKEHWNSVDLNGVVPDEILKDMIDKSYRLIYAALPKKLRIYGDNTE